MKALTTNHKYLDNFLLGILAGLAIGVGGFLNLLMLSFNIEALKYLGGVLFSVGLFSVCFFQLHLYTGKVGYVADNDRSYTLSLVLMYLGNIVGAVGFGYLMRLTGIATDGMLNSVVYTVANNKIISVSGEAGQSALKMMIFSFFCGIMVFLAVDIYKKSKSWLVKVGGLVVCVALFVICGMEHCIADMFYFAIANTYANFLPAFLAVIIATAGNSLGAIASRFVVKHIDETKEENK